MAKEHLGVCWPSWFCSQGHPKLISISNCGRTAKEWSAWSCISQNSLISGEIWLTCRNTNREAITSLAAVCAESLGLLLLTCRCQGSWADLPWAGCSTWCKDVGCDGLRCVWMLNLGTEPHGCPQGIATCVWASPPLSDLFCSASKEVPQASIQVMAA